MTHDRLRWMLTCAVTAMMTAAQTSGAAAQQPNEARIQELIRLAAARVAGAQATQAPPAGVQATGAARPTIRLTLDDAVKDALDHNLNIVVQRLNPEVNDISVASLKSVFRPAVSSQLATQSIANPSTSTISGAAIGSAIDTGLTTYNGGVTQNVPWGGGNFNVTLNNSKATTSSATALFNPTYTPTWSAQYTQPLLRGRNTDLNRQPIQVAQINRDISDVQLRSTITNTLSNVREAYWNYVFAVQSVDVAQQSVSLAEQLVQENQTRVQVGTMAPLDVVTAQSQAATARQNLVAAQSTMRTAELALKQLIVGGTQDPLWNATLDPVDRPDFRPEAIDLDAAVRRALSERTDLDIARKNMKENDVTVKFLRDQLLPQADLIGSYGWAGLGGTEFLATGTGVSRVITGTIPGGYSDSLSSLFANRFPRWSVTMNLSYPLGLSSAKATVARARVVASQVEAQVRQIELQVATDVTNAVVTVQSNVERVQAAQVARDLAQQELDAERSKFEVGISTNYLVIQAQRDLATAQNNELQAVLAYRTAIVELERLQQTTLTSLNVTLVSNATR